NGLAGSTVTYNATSGSPVVMSTWTYRRLQINGTSQNFPAAGNLTIQESLVLTAGTLDATATPYSVTVSSNWLNTGGYFNARPSTVTFDAGAPQKIQSRGSPFANVQFNNSAGSWVLQDSMTVTSSVTITQGRFDMSASSVALGGSWLNIGGSFTENGS